MFLKSEKKSMWWHRNTPAPMCIWTCKMAKMSIILYFVFTCFIIWLVFSFFFLYSVSTQPNITALCWPQTVCKTGSITTHGHSCTSGQGRQTLMHPNVHPRPCTHMYANTDVHGSSSATPGCRNRILENLEDHIWYGTWIVNESVWAQHCISVH